MKVNFNVKYKFKVNGKEYGSPEEMPAPIREAYEKAVGNRAGLEQGNIQSLSPGKIVFNGQEYESADSMPADIRRMYETIMETVESGEITSAGNSPDRFGNTDIGLKNDGITVFSDVSKPVSPESFFSARLLLIAAAIIALLGGFYFLFGGK
jgi:hypothetical protein